MNVRGARHRRVSHAVRRLKDRLSEARKEGENEQKRYQRVELVELYKMAAFLAGNSASFLCFESHDSTSTRGDRRPSSDRPRERPAFRGKKATPRSETRLSLLGRARASRRAAKERRGGLRGGEQGPSRSVFEGRPTSGRLFPKGRSGRPATDREPASWAFRAPQ